MVFWSSGVSLRMPIPVYPQMVAKITPVQQRVAQGGRHIGASGSPGQDRLEYGAGILYASPKIARMRASAARQASGGRPGRCRWWILVRIPVSRVTTIYEPVLFLIFSRGSTILFKAPGAESTHAKDRVQNTIRRVIILSMPPLFSRLVTSLAAGPKLKPLGSTEVSNPLTMALNALAKEKCWMTTALNMAATDESSMTGIVGFFHADPIRMIRRGIKAA